MSPINIDNFNEVLLTHSNQDWSSTNKHFRGNVFFDDVKRKNMSTKLNKRAFEHAAQLAM